MYLQTVMIFGILLYSAVVVIEGEDGSIRRAMCIPEFVWKSLEHCAVCEDVADTRDAEKTATICDYELLGRNIKRCKGELAIRIPLNSVTKKEECNSLTESSESRLCRAECKATCLSGAEPKPDAEHVENNYICDVVCNGASLFVKHIYTKITECTNSSKLLILCEADCNPKGLTSATDVGLTTLTNTMQGRGLGLSVVIITALVLGLLVLAVASLLFWRSRGLRRTERQTAAVVTNDYQDLPPVAHHVYTTINLATVDHSLDGIYNVELTERQSAAVATNDCQDLPPVAHHDYSEITMATVDHSLDTTCNVERTERQTAAVATNDYQDLPPVAHHDYSEITMATVDHSLDATCNVEPGVSINGATGDSSAGCHLQDSKSQVPIELQKKHKTQ